MLERDRIALRKAQAEIAAQEAAEKEEQERPIREAVENLNQIHRKIHATIRERILTQPDESIEDGISHCWVDPAVDGLSMDWNLAMAQNTDQYKAFIAENPWYSHDQESMSQLFGYFARQRHPIQIITKAMFQKAAERLREYGILTERPAPEPEPERPFVNLTVERPPEPEVHEGWDLQTGERRAYSAFEVSRMDSETFRRVFRLTRAGMQLPDVGPGPMGYRP
ncbi:MAG TPA: hypothetical protein VGN01_16310 [Acidobacteriaceae bacterium]|jgi:hypothetical protein